MISELNFKADFKVNHKNLPDRIQFLILQKNFILFLLKIRPEKKNNRTIFLKGLVYSECISINEVGFPYFSSFLGQCLLFFYLQKTNFKLHPLDTNTWQRFSVIMSIYSKLQ